MKLKFLPKFNKWKNLSEKQQQKKPSTLNETSHLI